MSKWREHSNQVIDKHFKSIAKAQPHLSGKQILRMVSLHHYPFRARFGHPYAIWLSALREYRAEGFAPALATVSGPLFTVEPTENQPSANGDGPLESGETQETPVITDL